MSKQQYMDAVDRAERIREAAPDLLEAPEDAEKRLRGAGMLGGADDPVAVALSAARGEK